MLASTATRRPRSARASARRPAGSSNGHRPRTPIARASRRRVGAAMDDAMGRGGAFLCAQTVCRGRHTTSPSIRIAVVHRARVDAAPLRARDGRWIFSPSRALRRRARRAFGSTATLRDASRTRPIVPSRDRPHRASSRLRPRARAVARARRRGKISRIIPRAREERGRVVAVDARARDVRSIVPFDVHARLSIVPFDVTRAFRSCLSMMDARRSNAH